MLSPALVFERCSTCRIWAGELILASERDRPGQEYTDSAPRCRGLNEDKRWIIEACERSDTSEAMAGWRLCTPARSFRMGVCVVGSAPADLIAGL